MKKTLLVVAAVLGLLAIVGGVILLPPHLQIRRIEPALPSVEDVLKLGSIEQGPVRISAIQVASQPFKARVAQHVVFVIEWMDGRMFKVDAGMDKAAAIEFSQQPLSQATAPLNYRASATEVLGARIKNVQGIGFTHLHIDHVQGVREFCEKRGAGAKVYQAPTQAAVRILHTREGAQIIRDSCLEQVVLPGEGIVPVPGYPGLAMLHVGGHTPDSTIFFVTVGHKVWVLSGDLANSKQKLLDNQGKGFLYSYLLVPENTRHLAKLRGWLAALDAQDSIEVIVSHDAEALAMSEIPKL